jgi:hypothetical protein
MPAIKLEDASSVRFHNVRTSGFDKAIEAKNSSAVLTNFQGGDIDLRDQSDFQLVNSEVGNIRLQNSRIELHNSIAHEILKVVEGQQESVSQDLRFWAERVIEANSPEQKHAYLQRLKQRAKRAEPYLKLVSYGRLVFDILSNAPI